MRYCTLIAGLMFAASQAQANDTLFAQNLGMILAAEKLCGFSYKQDAIEALIETNVSADNMSFPRELDGFIILAEFGVNDMTASTKTAHCKQVGRAAKSHGLID